MQVGYVQADLRVSPLASQLSGTLDSSVSLVCSSSSKPILCLWKTPYGHVYTLSKGVFAESGRLRHKDEGDEAHECGLEIVGLEKQDLGSWECEVGALIGDTFETATANIQLSEVKRKFKIDNLSHFCNLLQQDNRKICSFTLLARFALRKICCLVLVDLPSILMRSNVSVVCSDA